MHLPAVYDGGPHQPIDPGLIWSPTWRIDQPAATLWYHPHPHGETGNHTYRGLAGMFIIDDEAEAALSLPRNYGVDDIPVIVQDKNFGDDGSLNEQGHGATGILGTTLLVNGTIGPYHTVVTSKVRLRLLNASTARIYNFGFADGRAFQLVATDGGMLPVPVTSHSIQLAPAERAEIVVAIKPDERLRLQSSSPDLGVHPGVARLVGGLDAFDVLELRASSTLKRSPAVPGRLIGVQRPAESDAITTRSFRMGDAEINGREMDMDRIDVVTTVDTTEIWEITNQSELPHSFHVHDVQFAVLGIDGRKPPPELSGWKDTVYLPPRQPVRIIMRFRNYTDPDTPYMFHCHLMFHEDLGMMGQFVVVQPGQSAGVSRHHAHR
jgi:FtsP/CotA-like multicopper oxidase with cupredoxin domain